MQPSEVRARVEADHADLRTRLSRLERMAFDVLGGRATVDALRRGGRRLHEALCAHLDWEDLHLAPALRRSAPGGPTHSARLARDHREQRELLSYVLDRVCDATRPPVVLARDLLAFVELLRRDMADEERLLLSREALPDPVVPHRLRSRSSGGDKEQPGSS